MNFQINAKIINKIASLYTDNFTTLYFNGKPQTNIKITSGIR